jgi:Nucleotide modification associated domain 2
MVCYTYIVVRDIGFAPNPFGGFCTLATCKPDIRSVAKIGDWVIGSGSAQEGLRNKLIFAMQVTESMTFDEYWNNPKFELKKPQMNGSLMQAYGDNIYFFNAKTNLWHQENSHHSNKDGTINYHNLNRDTKRNKVLVSNNFYYFGKDCPEIPIEFHDKICHSRRHKNITNIEDIEKLINWIESNYEPNYIHNYPNQFQPNKFKRYNGTS